MPKQKYYVVWKGRKTGIFNTWAECSAHVIGFADAEYKSYESLSEARKAFALPYPARKGNPPAAVQKQAPVPRQKQPILPSISVDAACSGAPGPMEYRGVDTETGQQIFHQGPFADGTNNVGEFLALVHAMALQAKNGQDLPIYSDSRNALLWVKLGKCRTKLIQTPRNAPIFELIARAEEKLKSLKDIGKTFKLLKWDTKNWGENPADFGRK